MDTLWTGSGSLFTVGYESRCSSAGSLVKGSSSGLSWKREKCSSLREGGGGMMGGYAISCEFLREPQKKGDLIKELSLRVKKK